MKKEHAELIIESIKKISSDSGVCYTLAILIGMALGKGAWIHALLVIVALVVMILYAKKRQKDLLKALIEV